MGRAIKDIINAVNPNDPDTATALTRLQYELQDTDALLRSSAVRFERKLAALRSMAKGGNEQPLALEVEARLQ